MPFDMRYYVNARVARARYTAQSKYSVLYENRASTILYTILYLQLILVDFIIS